MSENKTVEVMNATRALLEGSVPEKKNLVRLNN
jgi:hypothetical protein